MSLKGRAGASGTRSVAQIPRQLSLHRFKLEVKSGTNAGTEVAWEQGDFTVGTDPGNQMVLTDPTVSRHHCVIRASPMGFLLRDLGSTNGTLLAGFRVESAYLKPGALISLGETTLRFCSLSDSVQEALSAESRYGRALGGSVAMRRLFALLPRIAQSDSTVLLEGETGTGKSLLAEAIHQASRRANGPFAVVECSSIPPSLIESELFGHEKGAFTGAHAARAGVFEAAAGGTVFLDELGELPLEMQPKLLRALEARSIKRIGSTKEIPLDVRLIAATNRELRQMVNRGAFRPDLFFRLNTLCLRIPPLRERREDIPLLVQYFYEQLVAEGETAPPALIAELERQDWPGNVRELRTGVERAVLLGDPELWSALRASTTAEPPAEAQPRSDGFTPGVSFRAAKEQAIGTWERKYLSELLAHAGGKLIAAARAASMDRTYLRELLRRHRVRGGEE